MNVFQKLEYFFAEKDNFVLVLFVGAINEENLPTLAKFEKELMEKNARCCAFYFRDVIEMHMGTTPALIRLQENARAKFGKILLSSLKPSFKDILLQRGIIRRNELTDNLLETWKKGR